MSHKLFFQTLGCPKNRVDSEVMLGTLGGHGYELVPEPEDADVMVVNTCSFIGPAKEESIAAIMNLVNTKDDAGGTKRLVVAGCFAQRYPDQIKAEIPEVDMIIGTGEYHRIADLLDEPVGNEPITAIDRPYYVHNTETPRVLTTPGYTAYLKIAEGCSQRCTFCIIPKLRGKQRSRNIEDLIAEAQMLAGQGVKEVNLIAQDLTHYGSDLKDGTELAQLLHGLNTVDGLEWIRLLYCYPHNVTDELVEAMAVCDKVLPYMDIPLQHIDDKMLMGMQRRTSSQITHDLLTRLRSAIPEIILRTTFIVGFPGETDAAHENLMEFVAHHKFNHVGVFTYSPENGTKAFRFDDDVPEELKTLRREQLMHMQRNISAEHMLNLVGQNVDVLVEGVSDETDLLLQGRYTGQAPDVDGVTYINAGNPSVGDIVSCEVVQAGDYDLVVSAND